MDTSQRRLRSFRIEVPVIDGKARADFDLPKDYYYLKVKHVMYEKQDKMLFVNKSILDSDKFLKAARKGIIETDSLYVPDDLIKPGHNTIEVIFNQNPPGDVDVTLSNYRKNIGDGIYILFFDSTTILGAGFSIKRLMLAIIVIFLSWMLPILLGKFFTVTTRDAVLLQLYSLLALLITLISLVLVGDIGKLFRIVIVPDYFLNLSFTVVFFIQFLILFPKMHYIHIKDQVSLLPSVSSYQLKSKLADIGIILSLILLIFCSFLWLLHLELLFIPLADIALLFLCIGVIIKSLAFIKSNSSNPKDK